MTRHPFLPSLLLALLAAPALADPPAAPSEEHMKLAARYSAANRGVSFLVLHEGQRIYEDYPNFSGPRRDYKLASGTKSFSGVAAAFAIHERLLSLDEKVADTITEWQSDPLKRQITVRHLLNLTSGLEPPQGVGRFKITYQAALGARCSTRPGSRFRYGPVHFQVFGELMRRKLHPRGFDSVLAFLRKRLFEPLGIEIGSWKELEGQPVLPHGASLTARNWAKFGAWLLRGGEHQGQQLVPKALLNQLTKGSRANPAYGLTFWLNEPIDDSLRRSQPVFQSSDIMAHPLVPDDLYMAAGAGDQRLYLIPSRQLVVVRQARGQLAAVLGRRTDFTDANLIARLLHGKDAEGKTLSP
ncbi:MAG TPA: serine hydrolase [Planctomycetes bacterium]|mgnify:CR=1 FL=1|nr:serine hydrolase [Planctomycetota bacterium]